MNMIILRKAAKMLAKKYWDLDYNIPLIENGRLTRSLGRMVYNRVRVTGEVKPKKIELSKELLSNYRDEIIIDVLKHELCHWALATLKKPFDDGHPVFENELRRIGAHSTRTIEITGEVYTVKCKKCDKEVARDKTKRRLTKFVEKAYTSRCCDSKLAWGEMAYISPSNNQVSQLTIEDTVMIKGTQLVSVATTPEVIQEVRPEVRIQTKPKTTVILEGISLEEVLIPGPRGVTNKQMIPAIIKAIDLNNTQLIKELQQQYPEVFQGSCKYLNKTYKSRYETLVG